MCSELSSNKYGRLFRPTTRYREHIDSGVVVTYLLTGIRIVGRNAIQARLVNVLPCL